MIDKQVLLKKVTEFRNIDFNDNWPSYTKEFSVNKEDVEIIVDLLLESDLNSVSILNTSERNYPLHLWRLISQLGDANSFKKLVEILFDNKNQEASWLQIEFPKIVDQFGPPAVPIIEEFLFQDDTDEYLKIVLIRGLVKLFYSWRKATDQVVISLRKLLENYKNVNKEYINMIIEEIAPLNTDIFADIIRKMIKDDYIDFKVITWNMIENLMPTKE